jgi:hypothetical protein
MKDHETDIKQRFAVGSGESIKTEKVQSEIMQITLHESKVLDNSIESVS